MKDTETGSTIDFVYSDGTPFTESFFDRLRDRVRTLLRNFTQRNERNDDICMADVLGHKNHN